MFPDQLSNYDNFAMRIKLMELEDPTSYTQRSEAETKTRFFTATHDNIDQVFEGHFLDDFLESVSDSSMQPVSKTCIDTSSYTSTANGAKGESAEVPRTTTPQLPYSKTQSLCQIDPNQWAAEQVHQTFRYTSTANGGNNVQLGESAEVPRTTTPQLPYTRTQSLGQIDPNQWAAEQVHQTFRYTSTANGGNNAQLGESAEVPRTTTPQLPYTRTQSLGQIDPNQWTTEELQHTVRRVKSLPTYRPKFGDEHNDEKFINRYLIDPGFMLQI